MIMIVDLSFAVSSPSSTASPAVLSSSEEEANRAPATAAPTKQRMTKSHVKTEDLFFFRDRRGGMVDVDKSIPSFLS